MKHFTLYHKEYKEFISKGKYCENQNGDIITGYVPHSDQFGFNYVKSLMTKGCHVSLMASQECKEEHRDTDTYKFYYFGCMANDYLIDLFKVYFHKDMSDQGIIIITKEKPEKLRE